MHLVWDEIAFLATDELRQASMGLPRVSGRDLPNANREHRMSTDGFEEMCPNCVTPWKCNGPHEFPPAAPEPTNVAGRWDDEGRKFIPGIAVTHTRSSTDAGPDYCDECSAAAGEWVKWPCALSQEPGETR